MRVFLRGAPGLLNCNFHFSRDFGVVLKIGFPANERKRSHLKKKKVLCLRGCRWEWTATYEEFQKYRPPQDSSFLLWALVIIFRPQWQPLPAARVIFPFVERGGGIRERVGSFSGPNIESGWGILRQNQPLMEISSTSTLLYI
ncbi:hypothetical protein CEXT_595841 [Caerostris extrusa]|uniref:Uncharacterized protein n=1 Tax=Caerostris extrusa TaxID=172846 RepID=A0AAV4Y0M8_CAEEX|nr:hypothetical protein CEXT_595841 [Caerostris extrusa]